MLNLAEMRTHLATGEATRVKFSLSPEAHDRLRAAAKYTGVSMSEIVETLVRDYVPDQRDIEAAEGRARADPDADPESDRDHSLNMVEPFNPNEG